MSGTDEESVKHTSESEEVASEEEEEVERKREKSKKSKKSKKAKVCVYSGTALLSNSFTQSKRKFFYPCLLYTL